MPALETTYRDDLADLVTVALGAVGSNVVATYDDVVEAENVTEGTIECRVYPGPRTAVLDDRGGTQVRVTCYVALYDRLPRDEDERNSRIDTLMSLMGTLELGVASGDMPFVEFENGETGRDPYDLEKLREQNLFASVLQPVFLEVTE